MMNDLDVIVRNLEHIMPEMSNDQLHRCKSLFTTGLAKVDNELQSTSLHTCHLCFFQEYGYREELPIAWQEYMGVEACFSHEYDDVKAFFDQQNADEPFSSEPAVDNVEEKLNRLLAEL